MLLMDRARDGDESGVVAIYAASVLRYIHACELGDAESAEQRFAETEIQLQVLTATMLLRRGQVKGDCQETELVDAFLDVSGHRAPASRLATNCAGLTLCIERVPRLANAADPIFSLKVRILLRTVTNLARQHLQSRRT
jgi:hypothetical protein